MINKNTRRASRVFPRHEDARARVIQRLPKTDGLAASRSRGPTIMVVGPTHPDGTLGWGKYKIEYGDSIEFWRTDRRVDIRYNDSIGLWRADRHELNGIIVLNRSCNLPSHGPPCEGRPSVFLITYIAGAGAAASPACDD